MKFHFDARNKNVSHVSSALLSPPFEDNKNTQYYCFKAVPGISKANPGFKYIYGPQVSFCIVSVNHQSTARGPSKNSSGCCCGQASLLLVEKVQDVVQDQVVAVLVLGHVLHQLGAMAAHGLHRLEDIDLAVLDDLLDARIRGTVNTGPTATIGRDNAHGSVVDLVPPNLHHVHQVDQRVRGAGHLVAHGPARQLEQLDGSRGGLHPGHHLGQRHDLLVDLELPLLDVRVALGHHVVHGEDGAVLLHLGLVWPEGGILLRLRGRLAEDHHRRALLVVDQGPELAQSVLHGPLCDNVLPGLRVAVHEHRVYVVREGVALEGGQVGPEIVGGHAQDIPVLLAIIRSMTAGTVADGEPRRLLADLVVLRLVLVHLGARVPPGLGLQPVRELGDGEPGLAADDVLLQGVVDELVLLHVLHEALPRLAQLLEVAEDVEALLLLGQLQVGIDGHVDAGSAAAVAAVHEDGTAHVVAILDDVTYDEADPPPELQQGVGEGARVGVPFGVVELQDQALVADLLLLVHLVQPEGPDVEVGQLLLPHDVDVDVAVLLVHLHVRGPVLVAHHLGKVEGLGQHHDGADVLLPDHAPVGLDGLLHGSLGHDVGVGLEQAVHVGGVHVVRVLQPAHLLQDHPVVVVGNALGVLVLLLVVLLQGMPTGVRLHLGGRLELQLVEHRELAPQVAELEEVPDVDGAHGYRLGQRVVLVAGLQLDAIEGEQAAVEHAQLDGVRYGDDGSALALLLLHVVVAGRRPRPVLPPASLAARRCRAATPTGCRRHLCASFRWLFLVFLGCLGCCWLSHKLLLLLLLLLLRCHHQITMPESVVVVVVVFVLFFFFDSCIEEEVVCRLVHLPLHIQHYFSGCSSIFSLDLWLVR